MAYRRCERALAAQPDADTGHAFRGGKCHTPNREMIKIIPLGEKRKIANQGSSMTPFEAVATKFLVAKLPSHASNSMNNKK
jgi:hypothetical protein